VWRILATDALKPWRYQYWIFPRDPHVAEKAGPIHKALLDRQIITGTSSDPNVLRLLPPLCLKQQEVDVLVEALNEICG